MTARDHDEPERGEARKVIQIAATMSTDDSELYALCDDGTIWLRTWGNSGVGKWTLIQAVPAGPAVGFSSI